MIQTQEVSITYQGDGVQTSFAYPYAYRSSEDIKGYIVNEEGYEKKITTNYRYDTVENKYIYPLQGEPLQAPWRIKLIRETPQQQNEKMPNKLPFSMIEKSLDWIVMILQEIGTRMNFIWHIRNDCKQSETNAKNSANAAAKSEENAAKSEENAANSQDMAQKWAMSPTSPDGNTDENSPTGLTQSSKIWAALSREYAGMSKFKLPIAYYNSVAEMKASETALVGRPCVTLGYYEPNDGGGSVYIVRAKTEDDTDDGGSIIALDNGNVAELIVDREVSVKQFGAKGDGTTDDTLQFNNALKYSAYRHMLIPYGAYLIKKNLFADNVISVRDAGTYHAMKPAYPLNKIYSGIDDIDTIATVNLGDEGYQGFCYDGKRDVFICAGKKTDDSQQHLYKLNTSFELEMMHEYTDLAHVNTLSYNPDEDKIYCLYDSNAIAVINPDTLDVEKKFKKDNGLTGLAYDQILKVYIGFGYWGNKESCCFYVYDSQFNILRKVEYETRKTTNGLCAYDGEIVALFLGEIQYFNILTGIKKVLSYDDKIELEDVDIKNGTYYFNSNRLGGGNCTFYSICNKYPRKKEIRKNEEVLNNIDMDNIKTTGSYKCLISDPQKYAMYHFPAQRVNFHLIVDAIRREHIVQYALSISPTNKEKTYRRVYEDGQWTLWVKDITPLDVGSYTLNTFYSAGFVTNDSKDVCFSIPFSHPAVEHINIECTDIKLTIRAENKYVITNYTLANMNVEIAWENQSWLNVKAKMKSKMDIINNTTCAIELINLNLNIKETK